MFIAETWTDEARLVLVLVQEKIKFKNKFIAARRNKAGGLVIFWKEDFDLTIETFSKNHIDTTMNKNKAKEWRFTGFYGEPDAQNRHEAWARLKNLKSRGLAPWICTGDFNEITKQSEKLGGRTRPQAQMQAFRDVLDECGFLDLGFVGSEFTWHKHFAGYTVWEHLDRAAATSNWLALFSDTKMYHLEADASNHRPLLVVPNGMDCSQRRPFRFEQMWMIEQGYTDTVQAVWQQDSGETEDLKVLKKVEECGKKLTEWSKHSFRNVHRELEKKRKLLAKAERIAMSGGSNS